MGYHVAIVRTGTPENAISKEEIISVVEGQFEFELRRDESGSITQASRSVSGEEILLFYDGTELWTKNPSEVVLKVMIEIASAIGKKARVRGDEGETYESATKTYRHPDDANLLVEEPKIYWAYWLSRAIPVLVSLFLIYSIGKFLFRKYIGSN